MMFFLLIILGNSVEDSQYRHCEQLNYCYRNRELDEQHWRILQNSFDYQNNFFQALIQDDQYDKQLVLLIYFLKKTIRVRIEPSESENFHRFDLSHERTVINQDFINSSNKYSHGTNGTHVFLQRQEDQVYIKVKPFSILILNKKGKLVTINPDDTAIFEHNRDRSKFPRLFDSNDFEGTIDRIPNGPTSVGIDFLFHGNSVRLHGLPEHTLNLTLPYTTNKLRKRNRIEFHSVTDPIRLFNVDINKYEIGNPMAMYGSIPFVIARSTFSIGMFWCNPSETWVDTSEEKNGVNARFLSEGGFIDVFFFLGSSPSEVIQQYTDLSGKPQLPQSFAFGFHASRWGWKSTNEVREVTQKMDEHLISHDSLWLDLDHTDDKMYFTFNPNSFNDIEKFQDEIDPLERKVIALIDPHIRVDEGYSMFEKAVNSKYLVRTRMDAEYSAECWPGESVWIDFFNPCTLR